MSGVELVLAFLAGVVWAAPWTASCSRSSLWRTHINLPQPVARNRPLKVATVAEATRPEPEGSDVLARARISRERDQAALRFAKDRDLGRLEATMARLDAEAEAAVVRPTRVPTAAEARSDHHEACRAARAAFPENAKYRANPGLIHPGDVVRVK